MEVVKSGIEYRSILLEKLNELECKTTAASIRQQNPITQDQLRQGLINLDAIRYELQNEACAEKIDKDFDLIFKVISLVKKGLHKSKPFTYESFIASASKYVNGIRNSLVFNFLRFFIDFCLEICDLDNDIEDEARRAFEDILVYLNVESVTGMRLPDGYQPEC